MTAYYNDIDSYAAQWLRNLIAAGHIAHGDVDERSIEDVSPSDLAGYTQCHFFAGIGIWSHALRLAGWPDDRPVWTGSCPCQPFSAAGKAAGFADERHLWPAFHHLIRECRPETVFGEQVASRDGLGWLDLVQADLEGEGYAIAAVDLCAAGVGAPHIRQRLWFVAESVADAERRPSERHGLALGEAARGSGGEVRSRAQRIRNDVGDGGDAGGLADAKSAGSSHRRIWTIQPVAVIGDGTTGRLDDAHDAGLEGLGLGHQAEGGRIGTVRSVAEAGEPCHPGSVNGHWRDADWLYCRDGKWRPVEPGTFPLAHGAPSRVGRLRAYGNAIVPQVSAEVIRAFMEARP